MNSPSFFDPYLKGVPYRCKQLTNPVFLRSMDTVSGRSVSVNGRLMDLIIALNSSQNGSLIEVTINPFTPRRIDKAAEIFGIFLMFIFVAFMYFIIGRLVFYSPSEFSVLIYPLSISLNYLFAIQQ